MTEKQGKKRRRIWPWILIGLIVIALAIFLITSANRLRGAYSEAKATVRDVSTYYSFSGNLTPVEDKLQTAKEQGKIKEIFVSKGDTVEIGDALLRLTDGTRVYALSAGTIESLEVEKEDTLAPGSPICRIVDYSTLEVSVDVDEYDVDALTVGKQASILINALGESMPATVSEIANDATVLGGVSYYQVKMTLPAVGGVKSGMSVEATVLKEQALGALCAPVSAISYDEDNAPYAMVMREGEIVSVPLELGVSDGQYVQVKSGLSDGETIYYTKDDMLRFFMMRNAIDQ